MFVILLQGLKIKVSTRSGEPKPADRIQNHHREAFASPCLGTVFKCHRAFRAARGGREEARKVRAGRGRASNIPGLNAPNHAPSHAHADGEIDPRTSPKDPRDFSLRAEEGSTGGKSPPAKAALPPEAPYPQGLTARWARG